MLIFFREKSHYICVVLGWLVGWLVGWFYFYYNTWVIENLGIIAMKKNFHIPKAP